MSQVTTSKMSAPKVKKSRSKTPPGQNDAGPSIDGKDQPRQRGRKLEFAAKKPLEGKKFYLELTGPRQKHQLSKLKEDIEELGGVVEQFLSKDLACVITNRLEAKDVERKSKGVPSGTSPAVSTPSPFHQGRESTPGATDSPGNTTKDSGIVTRGKAIVQKATKSQMYGTTDVLTNAKNWNIPVKHLDVLMKYLSREKEKQKLNGKDKKKSSKEKSVMKAKERQLTKPYLKVEDVPRRHRPITKEFGSWPRILLDTKKGSCPYDPKTRNEGHVQGAERTQDRPDASQRTPDVSHRQKELSRSQSLSKKAMSKAAKQREATASKSKLAAKRGFCEFCNVKYSNLEKHLDTEQHKQFVGEKNNYTNLDTMIAQGPNLVRFLEDCVRFQNVDPESSSQPSSSLDDDSDDSGTEDEVLLLPAPGTPEKARRRKDPEKVRKKNDPPASRRSRNLGKSPKKTAENRTSAEQPGLGEIPRKHLQSGLENNDSTMEKTASCKRKVFDHPADKGPLVGGGNAAGVEDAGHPGEDRNIGLEDRLSGGNGDAMNSQQNANFTSPGISTGVSRVSSPGVSESRGRNSKKHRSGGRRSLSRQLRESRTLPIAPQSAPEGEGVAQEGQEACVVLRGVAGEEEPIRQVGEEFVITRIRREDTLEEPRTVGECTPAADDTGTRSTAHDHQDVGNAEQVNENDNRKVTEKVSSVERLDRSSVKDGSQTVTSPGSAKQKVTKKRKRVSGGDVDSDDVFTSNPTTPQVVNPSTIKGRTGRGKDRDTERQKRKSRRSHADAPPQKVRGRSVRVGGDEERQVEDHEITAGSPCIREAQPRVPAIHGDQNSSDDFQQICTPASVNAKSGPGRKNKRARGNQDIESASPRNVTRGSKRKNSLRNHVSSSQLSTGDGNNSETDFQVSHSCKSNGKGKKDRSSNAMVNKDSISKIQKEMHKSGTEPSSVGEASHSGLPSGSSQERTGAEVQDVLSIIENIPEKRAQPSNAVRNTERNSERDKNLDSQAEQSLELVFRSDLGAEESSFLGFSQDDINETLNRSEVFQQQNLDKAALSVYCIPSSDPCPDEDRSSTGSNDFTIGLVLQKVENFPSEGSEWEEQVTGFMKRLDTQLEIKRRRESELSTLPSPNFHKTVFGLEKENQNILPGVVEDFGPEHLSDDDDAPVFQDASENVENYEKDKRSKLNTRRRSARINSSFNARVATRSTPVESLSYTGMCTSPSKKKRSVSLSKKEQLSGSKPSETNAPAALRELSPNQLMNSPQKNGESVHFSTPKRFRRNLLNTQQSPSVKHIVLPPGTPVEEQEVISNNYVHDDSEAEVIFPKFSSPTQKGSILSPVKHRVHKQMIKSRRRSAPLLGQRDVQSSPLRPSNRHDLPPFAFPLSSRKSLFMKGRVKRINISSPRKRSKSASSPASKSSQFLTFLNELKAGLSPMFYTFKKPHFSLRILQPSAVRRRHHYPRMSRSLLALNLCLPSDAELRIYEFHDDDSMDEEEDLFVSPLKNDSTRKELHDQCTQTPPSIHKQRRLRSRSLSGGRNKSAPAPNVNGKGRKVKEVEHDSVRKGKRNVKVQASSPEIDSIFDMPSGYYL
ncbi:uncharacterized protein LOC121426064 [Lytechinus variegatus]|uniref:uncharacterized protein LOC121426064 n=1 Tax=Lytechinus variegatus TaxID=7654 RepID=UPI001BB0F603|nr:uncharacterized protein LOC121426064 [Lytechinus variegatus]XP_041478143.1 uncharacterized protein LOC121426064 [Lytechinus variegatus]